MFNVPQKNLRRKKDSITLFCMLYVFFPFEVPLILQLGTRNLLNLEEKKNFTEVSLEEHTAELKVKILISIIFMLW